MIPPSDVQPLLDMGAAAVYLPGSAIADTAVDLIEKLNQRLGYAQPAPPNPKRGDRMIGALNHVGVATPSIADSIKLYRDVLGATKIGEPFDLPAQG